jgi:hypothetical protein
VPEVLRDGVTGFIASSLDDLVGAVHKVPVISRCACRDEFETRFTAEVMTASYERIYYQLIDQYRIPGYRNRPRPTGSAAEAALIREATQQ